MTYFFKIIINVSLTIVKQIIEWKFEYYYIDF